MKENPGSEKAISHGCKCPVTDNHYGKGFGSLEEPRFWITQECPLHTNNKECDCPTTENGSRWCKHGFHIK